MRRRPSDDVVSTSIRRQLSVNTMPTYVETTSIQYLYDANVGTTLVLRLWYVNVDMTSTQ